MLLFLRHGVQTLQAVTLQWRIHFTTRLYSLKSQYE